MFHRFLNQHDLHKIAFRSDIFPTVEDRKFWNAFQNEECISIAESEIDYSWSIIKATDFMEFKISGNRAIMENIYFDRRNHLILFALAELKENKGRFLPQLVNGIFTTCEESFWGLSAHFLKKDFEMPYIPTPAEPYIDLFAAETAEHLAMIVTLLKNPLEAYCPEIIDRVNYELDRRIKKPYETRTDFWWMGHGKKAVNNWNPWILSNILTVFLLCEKEERRQARAIRKIMIEAQNYYDSLAYDGGCDEGPSYWGRAGASLFEIVYQLKEATDGEIDLFCDEKLGLIASYIQKAHTVAGQFVVVADAHASPGVAILPLAYGFGRETKQEGLMNFSAVVYRENSVGTDVCPHYQRTLRRLIYNSQFLREMEAFEIKKPLHNSLEYLPAIQLAVLRCGAWTLSAKGGHNKEHHNHNDVGSLALYDGEVPVLVDVGINTYSRWTFDQKTRYTMIPWTQAKNHNIPMINGVDQKYGREFCADSFEVRENRVDISFGRAYTEESGAERVTRSINLHDSVITVEDTFSFAAGANRSVQEVLMTVLPVRIESGAAILGDSYRLSASVGAISTEYMPFDDAHLENDWKCDGVTRIVFEAENVEAITVKVEKINLNEVR